MLVFFIPRAVREDAAYWPGRRSLAALDAITWPVLWIVVLLHAHFDTGLVGRVAVALAIVSAVWRLHRALWRNERYRFTTYRWGLPLVTLAFVAMAMKATA